MRQVTVIYAIANAFQACAHCERNGNTEWRHRHAMQVARLCKEFLPSGSGFDNGTEFDWNASKPERMVFNTGFHHMNDHGFYDGWSHHSVIVTPSFIGGFTISIPKGKDRNGIKEYIAQAFHDALSADIDDSYPDSILKG